MKKIMGVMPLAILAAGVHAQNSITLYGIIDNDIAYSAGLPGGSRLGMGSGDFWESRLGLKGAEDLGAGLEAVFQLEMGLNTQAGGYESNSLFARHATVGLQSASWGTIKLGNLGAGEVVQNSFDVDPQLMHAYAIQTLVRGRNWAYAGNGFEYTSPAVAGLTVIGQYDFSNGPAWNQGSSQPTQLSNSPGSGLPGSGQGRSDGLQVTYQRAGLELMVIYDEIRDGNGQFDSVYVNSRSILAGGAYQIGLFKISAGYQHLNAPQASNIGVYGSVKTPPALPADVLLPTAVDHEWIGAQWMIAPVATVTAAVYHANANHGNGNATLCTLGATYQLSKRTQLYSELSYLRNSKTSNIGLGNGYTDPYGANANDDPVNGAGSAPGYGHSQKGAFVGVMVIF
ncbi:porin [Burkholderia sp. WAC0059]|uniref:porin n=1 Tax=Burkholderia sp. WAC0059 TaxID=2066022 RepID=UPI000C7EB580|nr:porin [Burkholderia sp. WAC0059]PLZ02431.1 porin [Burkholderia sp. WAC0059]